MTKGLERAGKTKLKLYRKCLESTSTGADRKEYTEYRNIFNNLKRNLKVQYYQQKYNQYKDNVKKNYGHLSMRQYKRLNTKRVLYPI